MDSFRDSVNFGATVLGTLIAFFGLFQSRAWVAAIGAVIACGAVGSLIYAGHQRARLRSAGIRIGSLSIDSLNLANLRRRLNRSLVVQDVENTAVIDGTDLAVAWQCSGYCRAERVSTVEFSIDADANSPFQDLHCVAFDLRNDPERRCPIRPVLVGPDGMSKKVAVPFLAPLSAQAPFSVALQWRQSNCMRVGIDYYAATLSFQQRTVQRYIVRLRFVHGHPEWVRAYELDSSGTAKILRILPLQTNAAGVWDYVDADTNVPASCARIYLFSRTMVTTVRGPSPDRSRKRGPDPAYAN